MALVLLPCDLPSWPAVQRHLNQIQNARDSGQLLDGMQKLHGVCCISLDPDESDKSDPAIFAELRDFLESELSEEERRNFFRVVLPSLVSNALRLKHHKPYDGLRYSLQQQADCTELERKFVAALVANAFFSTFPRRTTKTHPTLQDGNFSKSFIHLKSPFQRKKLREVLRYFEWIADEEPKGKIVLVRQVMSKKSALDVEDWLSCDQPLCPVVIRHNGKIERAELGTYQICFSSDRIGGAVLEGGERQEDLMFCVFPELYVALLFVETLELNEALTVHGMRDMTPSSISRPDDCFGVLNSHVCLIDAADFRGDSQPLQYRESSVLREANKAFVGFCQPQSPRVRLPPIGKSFSSTPPENRSETRESRTVQAAAHLPSDDDLEADPPSPAKAKDLLGQRGGLRSLVEKILSEEPTEVASGSNGAFRCEKPPEDGCKCGVLTAFESGTCTPVAPELPSSKKRPVAREDSDDSVYGDCQEHSDRDAEEVAVGPSVQRPLTVAKTKSRPSRAPVGSARSALEGATAMDASFVSCISRLSSSSSGSEEKLPDEDDEEGFASCVEDLDDDVDNGRLVRCRRRLYEIPELPPDLDSPRGRRALAATLQGRLRTMDDEELEEEEDSNFAVDIHIADPLAVPDPRDFVLRRSASTGFILDEDEDLFLGDGLEHEREWLAHFRHRSSVAPSRSLSRRNSSRYSFSSDFSSDLEDIYEHFEEKMTEGPVREDPAYSGRRSMKRTLSDSLTSFLPRTGPRHGMPRSMSLTEKMQEERTNIEQAKQNVAATATATADPRRLGSRESHGPASTPQPPLVGTLVSVDRNLSEVEECVTLPFPAWCRNRNSLAPQMSVWWNYNRVYDFYVPLGSAKAVEGEDRGSRLSKRLSKLDAIAEASGSSGESPASAAEEVRREELAPSRSKSAADARGGTGGGWPDGRGGIARSLSSEDVRMLAGEEMPRRNEPDRSVQGMKKWHAAGNLNLLGLRPLDAGKADPRSRSGRPSHEGHQSGELPADLELDVEGAKPLATGNWGCEDKGGDPQLKALIQWMAASRANVPFMIYYTGGDHRVVKLNIVCRVLLDRHWSVSHVLRAVLRHCSSKSEKSSSGCDADLLDSLLPKETEL